MLAEFFAVNAEIFGATSDAIKACHVVVEVGIVSSVAIYELLESAVAILDEDEGVFAVILELGSEEVGDFGEVDTKFTPVSESVVGVLCVDVVTNDTFPGVEIANETFQGFAKMGRRQRNRRLLGAFILTGVVVIVLSRGSGRGTRIVRRCLAGLRASLLLLVLGVRRGGIGVGICCGGCGWLGRRRLSGFLFVRGCLGCASGDSG